MTTETIAVTGMTCEHCVTSVTEEVSELDGVTGVAVDLVPGGSSTVTVTADHPLDDQALRGAIAEAGYEVVSR
ncbi:MULTISPECIES: heavy-metal-associated domain-containing protein [unclassified Curtobacterium]|uniref:heavy-metal-associated domain-containing protein n=1 Tax=unclassified Curtobacterium TaxID=257496 RepID=UPI00084FB898|nr:MULTISPECIES: heavy-metal-associated domain-containing protein [unclassified Curtobacterium]